MREEKTDGEVEFESSSQNANIHFGGKGAVLPYWKLEEVSFLQAVVVQPTAVVVLIKVT